MNIDVKDDKRLKFEKCNENVLKNKLNLVNNLFGGNIIWEIRLKLKKSF